MNASTQNQSVVPDDSAIEHWLPAWNQLSLFAFCLSTVFMVLLSVLATQGWPPPYNHFATGLAAMGPVALSCLPLLYRRTVSRQWFLSSAGFFLLLLLAWLNSLNSPVPMTTLKAIGLFLLTGPVAFWLGLVFFGKEKNRSVFLWMLSAVLLVLLFLGWVVERTEGIHLNFSPSTYALTFSDYHYPGFSWIRFMFFERYQNEIVLTLSNPISAGSALLLLIAGPLLLLCREKRIPLKVFLGFLLVAAAGLIVLIGKKSTLLALLVAVLIAVSRHPEWIKRTVAGLLITGALAWAAKPALITEYARGFTDSASYGLRLESWRFGVDVFLRDPLLGTGFNAPLIDRFEGYVPSGNTEHFKHHLRINNTLENMPLTLLTETGLLFVLAYGMFLWPALKRLPGLFKTDASSLLLIACLGGFVVHSLTFDSLRNPALNWLFHSLLALLAAVSTKNKPSCKPVR